MIEILTFFYHSDGMEYPKLLTTTLFDSLFLDSNIPALMKTDRVIHNIYCAPPDTQWIIENYLPMAKEKGLEVFINNTIIDSVSSPRCQLHLTIQDQIRKSINNKSVIIMAPPDMIFGNGLAGVINNLNVGEYLVCGHPRVSLEQGYEKIKEFLKTPKTNKEFMKLFVEEVPHFIVQEAKRFKHDYEYMEKNHYGWVMYFKEPPPVAFYGTEEILTEGYKNPYFGNFEVIDHDLPNMFFKQGKLKWIDDSDVFCWGEFTSDKAYTKMITNDWWVESAKFFHTLPLRWRTND